MNFYFKAFYENDWHLVERIDWDGETLKWVYIDDVRMIRGDQVKIKIVTRRQNDKQEESRQIS